MLLAEQALTALHMKRHGPPGLPNESMPAPDVVDTWGGEVDSDSHVFGIECVVTVAAHGCPLCRLTCSLVGWRPPGRYYMPHSDFDAPPPATADAQTDEAGAVTDYVRTVSEHGTTSRWGMHYLVTIITNTAADKAWQVVFQAPEERWEAEWEAWGRTVIDNVVVDWQKPSA